MTAVDNGSLWHGVNIYLPPGYTTSDARLFTAPRPNIGCAPPGRDQVSLCETGRSRSPETQSRLAGGRKLDPEAAAAAFLGFDANAAPHPVHHFADEGEANTRA